MSLGSVISCVVFTTGDRYPLSFWDCAQDPSSNNCLVERHSEISSSLQIDYARLAMPFDVLSERPVSECQLHHSPRGATRSTHWLIAGRMNKRDIAICLCHKRFVCHCVLVNENFRALNMNQLTVN